VIEKIAMGDRSYDQRQEVRAQMLALRILEFLCERFQVSVFTGSNPVNRKTCPMAKFGMDEEHGSAVSVQERMPPGKRTHYHAWFFAHRLGIVALGQPPFNRTLARLRCFKLLYLLPLTDQSPNAEIMAILACPRIKLAKQDPVNLKEVGVQNRSPDGMKVRQRLLKVRFKKSLFTAGSLCIDSFLPSSPNNTARRDESSVCATKRFEFALSLA
jgi:hypothetical protein